MKCGYNYWKLFVLLSLLVNSVVTKKDGKGSEIDKSILLRPLQREFLAMSWVDVPIDIELSGQEVRCDPLSAHSTSKTQMDLVLYFKKLCKVPFDSEAPCVQLKEGSSLKESDLFYFFRPEVFETWDKHLPKVLLPFHPNLFTYPKRFHSDFEFLKTELQAWIQQSKQKTLIQTVNLLKKDRSEKGKLGKAKFVYSTGSIHLSFPTLILSDVTLKEIGYPRYPNSQSDPRVFNLEGWIKAFRKYQMLAYKYLIQSELQKYCNPIFSKRN